MIDQLIKHLAKHPKILIIGFGREGKAVFSFLQKHIPNCSIGLADSNINVLENVSSDPEIKLFYGENYLASAYEYDLIIKSPGVKIPESIAGVIGKKLTSSSALFLQFFGNQSIGITGTKGKSTTSSLIHHLLKNGGKHSILAGNIGRAAFRIIDDIKPDTTIVYELSAHQLEQCSHSPKIALLLNLFEEHLDYFGSKDRYFQAKYKIFENQNNKDLLLTHDSLKIHLQGIKSKTIDVPSADDAGFDFKQSDLKIKGAHNYINALFAAHCALNCGISKEDIEKNITTFQGLKHRLEDIGMHKGIHFYNDSISTVPEASIAALKALPETDCIILGGLDRGISYDSLIQFLPKTKVKLILFTGMAGKRMMQDFEKYYPERFQLFHSDDYEILINKVFTDLGNGSCCLLSPAAASYDKFRDFIARGEFFQKTVEENGKA